jgi:hypothetical protein
MSQHFSLVVRDHVVRKTHVQDVKQFNRLNRTSDVVRPLVRELIADL